MAQSSKRDIIAMRKREAGVHVLVSGSSTGHCQLKDRSRSAVLIVGQDRDLLSTDSDRPIRVLARGEGRLWRHRWFTRVHRPEAVQGWTFRRAYG